MPEENANNADPVEIDFNDPITRQKWFDSEYNTKVTSLVNTKDAIKSEKTVVEGKLKEYETMIEGLGGNAGIESLQNMRKAIDKDERLKAISEGRGDEIYEKDLAIANEKYQTQLNARETRIHALEDDVTLLRNEKNEMRVGTVVSAACIKNKIYKEAVPEVIRFAQDNAVFGDDGDLYMAKDGQLTTGPDGINFVKFTDFMENDQTKRDKHYWYPASESGDSRGSGINGLPAGVKDLGALSQRDFEAIRNKQKQNT